MEQLGNEGKPPVHSEEKLHIQLIYANQLRRMKSVDKKRIKKRRVDPREILLNPPPHWKEAKIGELVKSVPGVANTKAVRILIEEEISPSRTVTSITDRQRKQLIERLSHFYIDKPIS